MHVVECTVDSDVRNAYQARCGAATFSSTCSLVTFTTVIVKYDLNYEHNLLSLCGESPCQQAFFTQVTRASMYK